MTPRPSLQSFTMSILGVVAVIAVTTTMDATGLAVFSALPLCPLMLLFWLWQRFSRAQMGFRWGDARSYGLAVLYPLAVLGAAAVVAAVAGAVDLSQTDWRKAGLNLVLMTASTVLATIVTEEGFFRGWLWASLERAGSSPTRVLAWSSLAFSLWHLSAVALPTGFDLPAAQIPVFMINAALLGAIWGLLRQLWLGDRRQRQPRPLERPRLHPLRLRHQDRCPRHPEYGRVRTGGRGGRVGVERGVSAAAVARSADGSGLRLPR